jgi:hypothetical protein
MVMPIVEKMSDPSYDGILGIRTVHDGGKSVSSFTLRHVVIIFISTWGDEKKAFGINHQSNLMTKSYLFL